MLSWILLSHSLLMRPLWDFQPSSILKKNGVKFPKRPSRQSKPRSSALELSSLMKAGGEASGAERGKRK